MAKRAWFSVLHHMWWTNNLYFVPGINAGEGINVGMHAGIAILISFSILGGCAIGVNIVSRYCAKNIPK